MSKFNLTRTQDNYVISGTLLGEDGAPNRLCQVVLHKAPEYIQVAQTTTNQEGFYEIIQPHSAMLPGNYELHFYGWGVKLALEPEGAWVPFNIMGTGEVSTAYIISSVGTSIKYGNEVYTPSSVDLSIHYNNVTNPSFTWKLNDDILPDTTEEITLSSADIFYGTETSVITCIIDGTDDSSAPIQLTAQLTLTKLVDGAAGPGVVYRGEYDEEKQYYRTADRADVVKYNTLFYTCVHTSADPAGPFDSGDWSLIGYQFEAVATNILLAQDANITRTLVLGYEDPYFGIIRSVNATDVFTGNGFYISNTQDGNGRFRVGNITSAELASGILWDGTNLSIKAANTELTADGKFWSNSGGFGGTVSEPKIMLNSDGLQTGETYIHGADIWKTPLSSNLENSTNGIFWNLSGTGSLSAGEMSLSYTTTTAGPNEFTEPLASAGWSTFTKSGNDITSAITTTSGSFFRTGQTTDMYLEAGYYKISFTLTKNSGTGTFRWRLSTSPTLSTAAYAGTDQTYSTSGTYTYYINVTTPGTYYWGCTIGLPGTANFSVNNIYIGLDGVTGPDANSFVYFEKTLDSADVGKVFEFKGTTEGIGEPGKKHLYKIQFLVNDDVKKEQSFSKMDGVTASPITATFLNTYSSGTLKVKIVYTNVVETTQLPGIT